MSINTVSKIPGDVTVRTVLISVADKSGLDVFVAGLLEACEGVSILSTGGTYAAIKESLGPDRLGNLNKVSDYTGQPEMQGGLVKTLDFRIYLGLLSERNNQAHTEDLERTGAREIDMVVCNLYPFSETVAREDSTLENARGNIDIGGPCMIRAAAKNYLRVASVCDPADYKKIIGELKNSSGTISLETRYECAGKAFAHTAEYDAAISKYLNATGAETLPATYTIQ